MHDDEPAFLGGRPIRPDGPPAWPLSDAAVADAICAAVAAGSWGQYVGPHVERLESLLCEFHDVRHAIACASGTLAVETALRAAGVGPGDEVILGAYEFEPTFLSIHAIGATPVLVDVLPRNASLDPSPLSEAITPATRVIIATHLHGGLVPMSQVMAIARERGIAVIEDAAQVAGAAIEGKPAGSWGDVSVLSFGGSKLLTAGRGGAILTSRPEIYQRARLLLARGIQQLAPISELQAAALAPQIDQLAKWTEHRQRMVERLKELLVDIPGLWMFENDLAASRPAYYKVGFFFEEEAFGVSRERFVQALRAEGIAFDSGFRAIHSGRSATRYRASGSLQRAEKAGRTVVMLHHPVLSLGPGEVEQVANAVRKTYRNASRLR